MAKASSRLVKISPDSSALDAAKLFRDGAEMLLACRPDGRLSGLMTKSDVMRSFVCRGILDQAITVDAVMQKEIVACTPKDTLLSALRLLNQHDFRHLPVEDEQGRALGVLNARDILGGMLNETENEEELLRDYVMGIGYR